MTKTKEELNKIKEEYDSLKRKINELSDEELKEVTGGDVTSANVVGYNLNSNDFNKN